MKDNEEFYEKFKESFEAFYKFIIELGFTMTNCCYPMSIDEGEDTDMEVVYGASSINTVISFTKEEKIQIFRALMDTMPKYRSKIRIFTPLVSLYSLIKQFEGDDSFSYPCRGALISSL